MSQAEHDYRQQRTPALVVGIGASAGGVEALQTFFAHVPAASGCAYVVVLHRSPEHDSQLAALLQAVARIPVILVTERLRVEPDRAYVAPPNQHLTMVDGELHVSPNVEPEDRRAPVDIFFRTLAGSHDGRGVCVILSGSGSDGSMGLKRVKERGGVVFVQNPREAAFAEMPQTAIATDLVDDVLPAAEIPARIVAYQASLGTVSIVEELLSINEELRTLNQELKVKVEEALQTSADLQNLVNATGIATIFLDGQLRIKRFTPAARELFNLIAPDQGRPLAGLTHQLSDIDVPAEAARVLTTLQSVEREVRDVDGRAYILRVLPYRAADDRIDGVVLTLFDITERKRQEQHWKFLVTLSDAFRTLSKPQEIQQAAMRIIGEHIGVDRVLYAEMLTDSVTSVIHDNYVRAGVPRLLGAVHTAAFGDAAKQLRNGQTVVLRNATADAFTQAEKAPYIVYDMAAVIAVPLIKAGQWAATLVVHSKTPRNWHQSDIDVVQETAERMWEAAERARAEQALWTSEEQFRRAIEEAPIPVIMHAEDGEVLQISRSWTELTGYTLADVPTLDAWLNHAYGHGANAVRTHVHDLFAGDQRTLNVTFDIRTRTGMLRHWSFSASSPGMLRDGRRFVVGMAIDITERTRVERALAEQARLLDLSNDAIIVRDVGNRILYWNHGATELYGWSREEAIGQDLHTLLQTEFEAPFAQLIAALHKHDRLEGEVVQSTRDGRRITALCRWSLDRDAEGQPGAILTTYNDITARKRAEETLRASEARFRTLADTVPQIIWTNDPDGRATYFNQRWFAYSGRSQEESIGLGWQAIVHPDDEPGSVERWRQALAASEVFEIEYRLRRADGTYRWHLGRNVPLHNDSEEVIGWFGSATDIEALKQAETAVQHARDELEQRVAERTTELRHLSSTRQELLERLVSAQEDERRHIARELHDSLGQYLSALALELVRVQTTTGTPPDVQTSLARLQRVAREIDAELDSLTMELRPPALDDLGLDEALRRYAQEWSLTGSIHIEVIANGFGVDRLPLAVETTAYRVVQEALTNVRKHAQARHVSLILERRPGELQVIVEDDGVGFQPEVVARERSGGRQLGLVGMGERATLAGGTVVVESEPGVGTTIFLRIPLPSERRGAADG